MRGRCAGACPCRAGIGPDDGAERASHHGHPVFAAQSQRDTRADDRPGGGRLARTGSAGSVLDPIVVAKAPPLARAAAGGDVIVHEGDLNTSGDNAPGAPTTATGSTIITTGSITTQGKYSTGIKAEGYGDIAISAGDITTVGYGANGIDVSNNVGGYSGGVSMPHSPRVADGRVYVLDSGRGQIVRVDLTTGDKTDLTFCPGFLPGLAIHGQFAAATLSKPRDDPFKGLLLGGELAKRDAEPWCGVVIADLAKGDVAEWIRLEGHITALFDVAILPAVICPMAVGLDSPEIRDTITFDPL